MNPNPNSNPSPNLDSNPYLNPRPNPNDYSKPQPNPNPNPDPNPDPDQAAQYELARLRAAGLLPAQTVPGEELFVICAGPPFERGASRTPRTPLIGFTPAADGVTRPFPCAL